MSKEFDNSLIYNAVYDRLTLEGFDPAEADKKAAMVLSATQNDSLARLTEQRRKTVQMVSHFAGWTALICAIAFGLFSAFWFPIHHLGKHDYAGYGPGKVSKHVRAATSTYLLNDLHFDKLERSHYLDRKAWKTTVTLPNTRKPLCVYVWNTSLGTDTPDLDGYHC